MARDSRVALLSPDATLVSVAFLLYALYTGSGMYLFPLLLEPVSDSLGLTRYSVSLAFSIYLALSGLVSPVAGRLGDMFDPSAVMLAGPLLAGGAFAAMGTTNDPLALYILFALLAVGHAAGGSVLLTALLVRRVTTGRGLVLGTATLGMSAGGLVLVPLTQLLIDTWGWRGAVQVLGTITVLVGVTGSAVLGRLGGRPAKVPVESNGADRPGRTRSRHSPTLISLATNPVLAALSLAVLLNAMAEIGTIQHQVAILRSVGIEANVSATLLGLTAGVAALGRPAFGYFGDRFSPRSSLAWTFVTQAVGLALLFAFVLTGNGVLLPAFVLVFGFGIGGCVVSRALVVGDVFGLEHLGFLVGLNNVAHQLGAASGAWLGAFLYDWSGDYRSTLVVFLTVYALSLVTLILVRPPALRQ